MGQSELPRMGQRERVLRRRQSLSGCTSTSKRGDFSLPEILLSSDLKR